MFYTYIKENVSQVRQVKLLQYNSSIMLICYFNRYIFT